ncbi:Uncharacterized protein QTN25_001609 [Entamoeba marina]
MELLKHFNNFLTTYHHLFPVARSLTKTLLFILPKSTEVPEKFTMTVLGLLEIYQHILSSKPTYPIRSLSMASALTVISPYIESLFSNTSTKCIVLFPIYSFRAYYSLQYFLRSGFTLIPSTTSFQIPLKNNDSILTSNPINFTLKCLSEIIHSLRPLAVLLSFAICGNDSYVPLIVSFTLSCIEYVCLYRASDIFTTEEKKIFKQRLTRIWVLLLFPSILKALKQNSILRSILSKPIPGLKRLVEIFLDCLSTPNISSLL